ncbi:hypothetical protein GQ44DRAFT_613808, partial [Phaeosphaeriaceae sp. PMI808]
VRGRKSVITVTERFLGLFSFSQLYQNVIFSRITPWSVTTEQPIQVRSSYSWLEHKFCSWSGLCEPAHLDEARWAGRFKEYMINLTAFLHDAPAPPDDWPSQEREIPQYVLDYAPLIHLFSGEEYWPGDMGEHLYHTTPHLNYTPLQATDDHPHLKNLGDLNKWGWSVYLQSDDNVEDRPDWLAGETNIPAIPDGDKEDYEREDHGHTEGCYEEDKNSEHSPWFRSGVGDTEDKGGIRALPPTSLSPPHPTRKPGSEEHSRNEEVRQPGLRSHPRRLMGKKVIGGRSGAPAVLIVVPKDDGVVDAFWFFFYSYNLGNAVFNVRFGNHVGDWEHTVVRFHNGEPKAVFFSEHNFGAAYTYQAVEKAGKRPIGYSATGSHAMYGTPGVHPYVLPGGILHDVTDRGPLWDPVKNLYSFTYNYTSDALLPSNLTPTVPTSWFYFAGHWGDKLYPLSDPRQYRFLDQYHYVNGPLGPRFKNLGRQAICQGNDECVLKKWIGKPETLVKTYPDIGQGDEMREEGAKIFFGAEYDSAS